MSGKSLVTVANEGVAEALPLTFEARAVQIHNLSASWLYVPDAGQPVPPFTYGAVLPLQGTSQARITWQTPSGITPPTVAKGQATALWLEDALPPSNGQQVVIPSQQVPLILTEGPISTNNISGIGTSTATVLASSPDPRWFVNTAVGANSFVLVTDAVRGTPVTVIGVQSGQEYLSGDVTTEALAGILSPADTQLQINVSENTDLTGNTFQLFASYGTQAVATSPASGTVVVVGNGYGGPPVLVDQPGQTPLRAVSSAGNTAVSIIFLGSVGSFTRIHTITASYSGATAGAPNVGMFDGITQVWEAQSTNTAAGNPPLHFTFPDGGVLLGGVGAAVSVVLSASGAAGIFGVLSLTYTQTSG